MSVMVMDDGSGGRPVPLAIITKIRSKNKMEFTVNINKQCTFSLSI